MQLTSNSEHCKVRQDTALKQEKVPDKSHIGYYAINQYVKPKFITKRRTFTGQILPFIFYNSILNHQRMRPSGGKERLSISCNRKVE